MGYLKAHRFLEILMTRHKDLFLLREMVTMYLLMTPDTTSTLLPIK